MLVLCSCEAHLNGVDAVGQFAGVTDLSLQLVSGAFCPWREYESSKVMIGL